MQLQAIHTTKNCASSTCPTIYRDEAGRYVLQGFKVDANDKATMRIPEGEDAIILPADFMEEFIQKQQGE